MSVNRNLFDDDGVSTEEEEEVEEEDTQRIHLIASQPLRAQNGLQHIFIERVSSSPLLIDDDCHGQLHRSHSSILRERFNDNEENASDTVQLLAQKRRHLHKRVHTDAELPCEPRHKILRTHSNDILPSANIDFTGIFQSAMAHETKLGFREHVPAEEFKEAQRSHLRYVVRPGEEFRRIQASELVKAICAGGFKRVCIIDARFPYEHAGGHIRIETPSGPIEAMSVWGDQENIKKKFLKEFFNESALSRCKETLVVFHCEFSKSRGPRAYRLFADIDSRYRYRDVMELAADDCELPEKIYPECYLLTGGYRQFFTEFNGRHCFPNGYVEMSDPNFAKERADCFRISKCL